MRLKMIKEKITKKWLAGFIAILLGMVPIKSFAGSWNGWIYQNPYPTANTLLAVRFVTPNKGWVAGEHGTMLYTEDGGENWEAQESGTEQELKGLSVVNEKTGWAAGNGGVIVHTDDGGKTWVSQGSATKATLNSVFFINDKEGWAVGDNGTVLHTIDGGKKWERQNTGIKRSIASVFFINSQTGWILAGDEVYRTNDNGKTWNKSELPVKMPRTGTVAGGGTFMNRRGERLEQDWSEGELFFVDDQKGWAVVGIWFLFHTEDGGKTWTDQLMTGPMTYSFSHLFFTDSKRGCATGTTIICTEDGKTWRELLGVKPGDTTEIDGFSIIPKGISFVGDATGWAVGSDGLIMKTEDGGKTWTLVVKRDKCGNVPFFLSRKIGWLYYQLGHKSICRTDDGGHTWIRQEVEMEAINLFFLNESIGWAAGRQREKDQNNVERIYGIIKQTTDGGKTWTIQFKELLGKGVYNGALYDVYFVDDDNGWALGDNDVFLRTTDGGKHWEQRKTGTKLYFGKIWFSDAKTGWIAGKAAEEKGFIIYTNDGGKHWQVQHKKERVGFYALFFLDKKMGWVTGSTEYEEQSWLLYTENGGKTWSEMLMPGNIPSGPPAFLDKNRGGLAPHYREGVALITTDGGKSWIKQRLPIRKYPWHFSELFETQLLK